MTEFLYIADQLDRDRIQGGGHADTRMIVSNTVGLADLPAMFTTLRGPNAETKVHVLCN